MWFFRNGSGWLYRHDPSVKQQAPIIRKSQAPIFRKLQASIKHQAQQVPSDKHPNQSSKRQALIRK